MSDRRVALWLTGILMGAASCGGPASDVSFRADETEDSVALDQPPEYWASRLNDRIVENRREALSMLGQLGRASSSFAPQVVPLLLDPDERTGFTAAWALANMGRSVHPLLIARLDSPNPTERERAAYGIGELGPAGEGAIDRLQELSTDRNSGVRDMAIWALSRVSARRMIADPNMSLTEGIDGTEQERIEAIQRLGIHARSSGVAVRELIVLLGDRVPAIRNQAIQALSEAGPTALPSLSAALSHRNGTIRRGALVAISRMHRSF